MKNKKIVTYSLLAHINNTGKLSSGLLDIFVPLVKSSLSYMNNQGFFSGKNISEIQKKILELYNIDIPIPVLRNILILVAKEVNDEDNVRFTLYNDGAFAIRDYLFEEFDELINQKTIEIENIEKLFKEFCQISNISKDSYSTIFEFLEKNKIQVSKYLSGNLQNGKHIDYSVEAQFVDFFRRIPAIFNTIKDLYLGSIISNYIEYSTNPIKSNIELLLDTNFLVSLIDLNTPESTHSCRKLIQIAKHNGYKLSVLHDTLEETQRLLLRRAEHFNEYFLNKKINPEDIYNACDRRNLSKTDLERIADNLENDIVTQYAINKIPHTDKYQNIAKHSIEYNSLQKFRNSKTAALHDATALYYVREKRNNKRFKAFENVPCWFVNNAINPYFDDETQLDRSFNQDYQPDIIKVDTLLNILWLSNPNIDNCLSTEDISKTGLASLISSTLNESLPKSAIIRELDDNIQKYAAAELEDVEIVRVATRIANRQLVDIEKLNELAKKDKEAFVKKLHEESIKQKEIEDKRIQQVDIILNELQRKVKKIDKTKNDFDAQLKENKDLKKELAKYKEKEIENEIKTRDKKREDFIKGKLKAWRRKSWIEFVITIIIILSGILWLMYKSNWDMNQLKELYSSLKLNILFTSFLSILSIIFSGVVIKTLFNKYRNHSNIKAFIDTLKIPEDLKQLNK